MNPEWHFTALLLAWAVSFMLAITFFVNGRLLKTVIRVQEKTINEYSNQDRGYLDALHRAVDERTDGGISYSTVKHVFGAVEANRYQEDSLRLCKKFGLRSGYYRVDDFGEINYLERDDDFRNMAFMTNPKMSGKRPAMPPSKRFRIFRRDGFRCQICGLTSSDNDATELRVDHKVPFSKGGTEDEDNLWTLCNECNAGKSDTLVPELFGELMDDALGSNGSS